VQPDENNEGTILNNILLTSELKGYIEQPNYYFTNRNDKTKADLDILLLTQGYRRYEWKQISTGPITTTNTTVTTNPTYLPEKTQELSGTLTTPGGKPIPKGKVTLVATKQNLIKDTTADADGHFTFTNLYLTDTTTLVLRARKENNGSNVKITPVLLDYPKTSPAKNTTEVMSADTAKIAIAQKQFGNYQREQKENFSNYGHALKMVTITGVKHPKQPDLKFSSNLNGPGHADQVIMYDKLGDCVDLIDCLTGRILGVRFTAEGWAQSLRTLHRLSGPLNMTIIVDGVLLPRTTSLNEVNPKDIYSIEVLKSGGLLALYGSNAPGGALVITMKHGGEGTAYFTEATPNGIVTFPFAGFYKAKAFYSPKYEHKTDGPPDTRSTIYWNPNILTDKDGKASIEYFNNDSKGVYRIVVEGIDDDGKLGRQVSRYEVK
jgi:hypothetical protein